MSDSLIAGINLVAESLQKNSWQVAKCAVSPARKYLTQTISVTRSGNRQRLLERALLDFKELCLIPTWPQVFFLKNLLPQSVLNCAPWMAPMTYGWWSCRFLFLRAQPQLVASHLASQCPQSCGKLGWKPLLPYFVSTLAMLSKQWMLMSLSAFAKCCFEGKQSCGCRIFNSTSEFSRSSQLQPVQARGLCQKRTGNCSRTNVSWWN